VDRAALSACIEQYERAWRSAGTAILADLFTADATYSVEPYAEPIVGLEALARWWEDNRDGPDEVFSMKVDVVAVDGEAGVARVEVTYGDPIVQEYRDLWVVRLDPSGRCKAFEEWPFWPGHGRSPSERAETGDNTSG